MPYAASSLVSSCSTFVARKARKQDAHDTGSVTSLRRDPLTNGCMAGATDPASPSSCSLCRSRTLSARNSLKSTNLPLRTRSTTLAGIGGSAGEIISGSDLPVAIGLASPGSGVASSVDSSGTVDNDVGVVPEQHAPLVKTGSGDGVETDNNGTEEIEAAGGSPVSTPDDTVLPALAELLPADGRGNYHNARPSNTCI